MQKQSSQLSQLIWRWSCKLRIVTDQLHSSDSKLRDGRFMPRHAMQCDVVIWVDVAATAAELTADLLCCHVQVKDSVDVADACRSYFQQLFPLNPGGIVPAGPTLDDLKLCEAHGRGSSELGALFHEHKAPSATPAMAV